MKTSPEQVPGWLNAESFKDEIEEPMQKGSTKNRKFTRRFLELCFRVSLNNSFLYTETEMKGKPLSFLSRSFRASVGPGFQVAFPIPSFMESNRPFISPVFIHEQAEEWEHSFIQKTLRIHFSSWKLSFDTEEMNDSFVYRRPSFRFPFRHREVVMKTLQHLILEAGFSGNQHFELVLRLLLVLFVQNIDLDQDTRTSHDIELLLFRRHLSGWLQNFACTWSQEERNPAQDQFLYIFHLLTRGEIEQAVKFCSETKNFRLACMVAKGMQLQDEGYRSSCLKIHRFYCGHVPKDLDRIYALLSGDILHATENLSLSWYRTFGLHFWYGSGALVTDSDGLKCSLQSYIDEWQSNEFVAPPVPPHIVITVPEHEQLEASKGLKSDSLIYDACYVLLCIAADLYPEHVQWMHLATPLAYGVVYDALDAHKPWLVCEILSSICATSYLEPKVIISFAIQLEMMHLYTWAFYVLWSCEVFGNNNMFYLKNVFIHWFPWIIVEEVEGTDGKLSSDRFLREELGVPASWFEEAACIYSRYNFQFIEEVDHLCVLLHMEADEYPLFSCVHLANRAHQVVLGRAAPSVFVLDTSSVQWRKLKKILSVLGAIDRDYPGMIRDYKNGGSILEGICSIIQGFRLSLEDLESLLKNMELFSSLVSNLGCSKQGDMTLELFITCIFSHVFRETWKQLMEDTDDSKFQRLASCLETLQYSSHVPWSCKQFIHNFIETYRSSGISFTRELSTRSYFQLFDLWFPRKLVE
ncbi:Nuclear pore complex protein Nup98-Nup96 [Galdieria sulphuraria]|nr:Nuclear pore complex protein Nup98-Nup96 [Galdieria sulphuraria]